MKLCVTGGAATSDPSSPGSREAGKTSACSTIFRRLTARAIPKDAASSRRLRAGDALDRAFGSGHEAVLHFAAFSVVADSVKDPVVFRQSTSGERCVSSSASR